MHFYQVLNLFFTQMEDLNSTLDSIGYQQNYFPPQIQQIHFYNQELSKKSQAEELSLKSLVFQQEIRKQFNHFKFSMADQQTKLLALLAIQKILFQKLNQNSCLLYESNHKNIIISQLLQLSNSVSQDTTFKISMKINGGKIYQQLKQSEQKNLRLQNELNQLKRKQISFSNNKEKQNKFQKIESQNKVYELTHSFDKYKYNYQYKITQNNRQFQKDLRPNKGTLYIKENESSFELSDSSNEDALAKQIQQLENIAKIFIQKAHEENSEDKNQALKRLYQLHATSLKKISWEVRSNYVKKKNGKSEYEKKQLKD